MGAPESLAVNSHRSLDIDPGRRAQSYSRQASLRLCTMKHAVVIIPTYNESGSIAATIQGLLEHSCDEPSWRCSLLVVDANSPDGTADLVRKLTEGHPEIHLLVEEKKEGIGAAYFKGFQYATEKLHADALIEFDGDSQHPPEALPSMLYAIDEGCDLVLGSRRLPGGGYPARWDPLRLFLSRVGGFLARVILFFPFPEFKAITDPTTGLKATRVDGPFRKLDFSAFANRGFGYKIEMLFRLAQMGARIGEVPLRFRTRAAGESKMTQQTPVEILGAALRLRLAEERTKRFLRFCLVGVSGFAVNAVLLELFVRAGFVAALAGKFAFLSSHPLLAFVSGTAAWAAAFSIEGSIINNFLWNNFWTFHARRAREAFRTLKKFLAFNLLSVGGIIIQFCTVGLAARLLGNTTEVRQITLILTILFLVLPYNWLAYNKLVWRKRG
jgi:dolichol-phosphate mannosyltransferase